jgi:hypothetical protein
MPTLDFDEFSHGIPSMFPRNIPLPQASLQIFPAYGVSGLHVLFCRLRTTDFLLEILPLSFCIVLIALLFFC